MEKRIRELMEAQALSPSKFAEAIGVQRSNISHILSGRNKPSLELINKILDRYPEVNTDWLLLGKGPLFTREEDPKATAKKKAAGTKNFSFNPPVASEAEQSTDATARKPVKIVVFYSDQTFEEFNPTTPPMLLKISKVSLSFIKYFATFALRSTERTPSKIERLNYV